MMNPRTRTAAARPTSHQRDDPDGAGTSGSLLVSVTSDGLFSRVSILFLHSQRSRSRVDRFVFRICNRLGIGGNGSSVQEREHGRYKDQCRDGSAEQTSNDSAAQRRVLLTAISQA